MAPKPLLAPYPPDLADDQPPTVEFGDLVDAVVVDVDWAGQRAPGFSARRVALRRCRLTGAELAEATIADVTFGECRIDLAGLRHARAGGVPRLPHGRVRSLRGDGEGRPVRAL